MKRRIVYLYVDNRHVGAIFTDRTLRQCVRQLKRERPYAPSHEATIEPREEYERLQAPDKE